MEAVPEMDRLVATCGAVAARKRAAVARAKAAIETADAEERASAVGLLQAHLREVVKEEVQLWTPHTKKTLRAKLVGNDGGCFLL